MFDERAALQMRMEQMNDAEERLMAELQKERGYIYARLREIDKMYDFTEEPPTEMKYLESTTSFLEAPIEEEKEETPENQPIKRGRPSKRSKTTKMREVAVGILKEQEAPIRGVKLQRAIEEKSGFKIANMTTFMNTIINYDDQILKIGRGLYAYQRGVIG